MTTGNITSYTDDIAKTELGEGIKALQVAMLKEASTLFMAQEAMANAPSDATKYFDEAKKAFDSGDNNAAIMYLSQAIEASWLAVISSQLSPQLFFQILLYITVGKSFNSASILFLVSRTSTLGTTKESFIICKSKYVWLNSIIFLLEFP